LTGPAGHIIHVNVNNATVLRGSGRYHGQEATFLVAARPDGATLWSVRTADGRVHAAWSDEASAEGVSWSTGIRFPLDLEDLEHHVRVTRAVAGIERPAAGADLEMVTAAGPLRLVLDRSPEAFALTTGGQPEWELSVASSDLVDDWPSLRASVAALVSRAGAEWRSREPAALEARLVAASGHLLVRIAVNGVDGWFILDTGATEMVLMPEFARRAGAVTVGAMGLTSIAGLEQAAVVHLETVDVGPLRLLHNAAVISHGLADLPETIGDTVDGVIGAHIFARAVVTVDLAAGTATIAADAPDHDGWIPVALMNLHAIVPAEFEGRTRLFRVDTGAVPALLFHGAAVRRDALLEGRETTAFPDALPGALELHVGTLADLTALGVRLEKVDACFLGGGADVLSDVHTSGVIGVPVLRQLGELIIDLPRCRVAVRPRR
jgi:hypothetical protein